MLRVACLAFPLVAFALLGGCSDPVPPTPQGAFQVNFSDNGAACSIASHRTEVGEIDASTRTTIVVDGVTDAKVSCTVSGAGPFSVSGKVQLGSDLLNIVIPAISPGATEMSPATGGVSFISFRTQDVYQAGGDMPCNYYFTEGTGQGVAAGKIWVSFVCPMVFEGDKTCGIAESHVILENCDQ